MGELVILIFEIVLLSPFSVPRAILESEPPRCGYSFAASPYAGEAAGYLEVAPCPAGPARTVAGDLSLEGLSALDAAYGRLQGRARLLTAFRLEVDAVYGGYFDSPGDAPRGSLAQLHVDYRFAQNERLQFRAGAGARSRFGAGKPLVGFDAVYAVDVFWPRPVVASLEASGGSLGIKGWAAEARGTLGCVIGPIDVYAGWDGLWLGTRSSGVTYLGGPVVGARAFF